MKEVHTSTIQSIILVLYSFVTSLPSIGLGHPFVMPLGEPMPRLNGKFCALSNNSFCYRHSWISLRLQSYSSPVSTYSLTRCLKAYSLSSFVPLKGEEMVICTFGKGILAFVELLVLWPCDVLFFELLNVPVFVELYLIKLVLVESVSMKLLPFCTLVKVCLASDMFPWSYMLLMFLLRRSGMLSFIVLLFDPFVDEILDKLLKCLVCGCLVGWSVVMFAAVWVTLLLKSGFLYLCTAFPLWSCRTVAFPEVSCCVFIPGWTWLLLDVDLWFCFACASWAS